LRPKIFKKFGRKAASYNGANMEKNKNAEGFIAKHPQWEELLTALREILRSTGLEETIKWGVPVYTLEGKNIVGIAAFKNHAALWFHQGALLKDPASVLVNAQEGRTRAQRQWRFQPGDTVDEALLRSYVAEAIRNQEQGKCVKPAPKKTLSIPPELADAFGQDKELKSRFDKLAPYKQRDYAEHVSGAKRADTRARRLEKIVPMILAGKGLNDRYM